MHQLSRVPLRDRRSGLEKEVSDKGRERYTIRRPGSSEGAEGGQEGKEPAEDTGTHTDDKWKRKKRKRK